jgi:hypothetical protein
MAAAIEGDIVAATSAEKGRHLTLVRPGPVYDDHVPRQLVRDDDDDTWEEQLCAGRPPSISPEPEAHERWIACDRPDDRLRYGAYLCDCATCLTSLARMVREHRRPGLSIVIVTEADRIATSARELLAQLEAGNGYAPLLFVTNDVVRRVYVGRGATHETRSEAQYHWQARSARDGRYLPRPRLDGGEPVGRHPASTAPTSGLSLRLPRELERVARETASNAGLDLETWIVEALRASLT